MQQNYPPDIALNLAMMGFKPTAVAALGATADAELPMGTVGPGPSGIAIGAVYINPGAGTLTASDSVFRTIVVQKRTAGGSPVTLATATTKVTGGTGNWAAWTPVAIPVVAGAFVSPGDSVSVAFTHASSGTAIPACVVELFPTVQ